MKKFCLTLIAAIVTAVSFAQPCDKLFFSEYVEGGSNRKAVEIYNPTSAPVSLFGYKITIFSNGNIAPAGSFNLNATIAAGDVYVIAYSQADSAFKTLADTVSGALSFNGNDAVVLLFGSDTIDVVGIVGNDPGANGWAVDTANTTNNTLIRKSTVQQGEAQWDTAQWYTLAQDTTLLGSHTGPTNLTPCISTPLDTTVIFLTTSGTFTGVNGNYTLQLSLNLPHTDSMTVDVLLTSGNTAWINNYVTQTVSFPSGSVANNLPLTITNDTTGGLSHTLTFTLRNTTGGLLIGTDSVFTLTLNPPVVVPADTCGTLFFSEYVEGSSNNKAIEIYNPTAAAIDMNGYKVQLYINGSTTPSTTFNLSAVIPAGGVYVITSSQADSLLRLQADTTSSVTNYNGNDAVVLLYGTDTLDVIGVIGFDPTASGWTVDTATTTNHSLVRKAVVKKGNEDWAVAVNQWVSYGQDSIHLGTHTGPLNVNPCFLISGIIDNIDFEPVRVYPNPSSSNFIVEMKNSYSDTEVNLFDLSGKRVFYSKTTSSMFKVDAHDLNPGIYILEIKTGINMWRSKLSVQR